LGKPKVMENKIHFKPDIELLEQLLKGVNTEEAYDEAISDFEDITERRLEESKMKTIQEIKTVFEQILHEVARINGIPIESATQVATVILQESGKFERTEMMNNNGFSRNNSNNISKPISEKQIKFLQDLGIKEIPKTSREASKIIDEVRGNTGRVITAPSFK